MRGAAAWISVACCHATRQRLSDTLQSVAPERGFLPWSMQGRTTPTLPMLGDAPDLESPSPRSASTSDNGAASKFSHAEQQQASHAPSCFIGRFCRTCSSFPTSGLCRWPSRLPCRPWPCPCSLQPTHFRTAAIQCAAAVQSPFNPPSLHFQEPASPVKGQAVAPSSPPASPMRKAAADAAVVEMPPPAALATISGPSEGERSQRSNSKSQRQALVQKQPPCELSHYKGGSRAL